MTIYLVTPHEDLTIACLTSTEALRFMEDHIGMYPVSRQQYQRENERIAARIEHVFVHKANYMRWRKGVQP